MLRESAQGVGIGLRQPTHLSTRGFQIIAIGQDRIARRAALHAQHFEIAIDERRIAGMGLRTLGDLGHQLRMIASAAIIRASGSSPTRCSAATI
jgi:hypothetical protein